LGLFCWLIGVVGVVDVELLTVVLGGFKLVLGVWRIERVLVVLEVERSAVVLGGFKLVLGVCRIERVLVVLKVERSAVVLGAFKLVLAVGRVDRRLAVLLSVEAGLEPPTAGKAAKVCGPTIPSTVRLLACWKRITAL
jgi:hypothetical protein